jgi:hypothetical protein
LTPQLRAELRAAVERALAGDWPAAHEVAQQHEDDPTACWLHAVAHRMEGDRSNASYWYRRCGRAFPEALTTAEELRQIRASLDARGASP